MAKKKAAPKKNGGDSSKPHLVLDVDWQRFWYNLEQVVTRAVAAALCGVEPPKDLKFSVIVKDSQMKICDVTASWTDPASWTAAGSPPVTVLHLQTSTQQGTNPAVTNNQDVPPSQSSVVVTGVPAGTVVSVSVIADTGTLQSPALTGTFTVPDLDAPQPAGGPIGFQVGNIRDDGTTPPPSTNAPAADGQAAVAK